MKEKYTVFILGMVLISVLFLMLAGNSLRKNLGEIENYDKKIKTTLEKLNSAMIMDQQLSQFREILDNSLTTEKKFSVDELNNFQRGIEMLRDQNQLKLIKISDSNKFTQVGMLETTYTIELQGTFRQMGQFISELEAQNHIIKIQYLDVSPLQATEKSQATDGSANIYRITMEMSILKVKKEV